MINIGSLISNYVVVAVAGSYVLAANGAAPSPYAVWTLDSDGDGVHNGRYFTDRMDAEWEFCSLAFEWFQDNVLVCDEESECRSAKARAKVLEDCLSAAHRSLAAAIDLVDALVLEHEQLCHQDDRITDEPIEKVAREFAEDILGRKKKRDSFDEAIAILDGLKASQMQRKEMLHDLNQATKSNAPQGQDAEQIKIIKTLMAKMEKASNAYHSDSEY